MKKIIIYFFIISCLLYPSMCYAASPPHISAKAASVMDVESGRVLYQLNGDERKAIASLTKIMTAIVAIENGKLDDIVTTGPNATKVEGSSIYLRLGEKLSLEDLLYGLMLRSGNDAAIAIAEHIGGSVEGFVFMMNQKAEILGLSNTHFMNPHGLDHQDHYSSANDLATLTSYALQNPIFQEIVGTKEKKVSMEDQVYIWHNKNKMLNRYPGADGVKTGYTRTANRTLVTSATRDHRQIVVVTLNDGNDWEDSARLLDYGFNEYQMVEILQKGQRVDELDGLEGGKEKEGLHFSSARQFRYPLKEGELKNISSKVEILPDNWKRGVYPHGYIHIYLKEERIGSIPLVEEPTAVESFHLYQQEKKPGFWQSWMLFWKAML